MSVTFSEAARQLGFKTRASLYRCRDDGRLAGYITADGKRLELQPPGLPPLADHLKAVLQPQRRERPDRDPGVAALRARADVRVSMERGRQLRLQNDVAEGKLADVAEVRTQIFRAARAARDHFQRLPLELSHRAVELGLPADRRAELVMLWDEQIDAALVAYATDPMAVTVA